MSTKVKKKEKKIIKKNTHLCQQTQLTAAAPGKVKATEICFFHVTKNAATIKCVCWAFTVGRNPLQGDNWQTYQCSKF